MNTSSTNPSWFGGTKAKTFTECARIWFGIASAVLWCSAIGGVILGIALATHTSDSGRFTYSTDLIHPFVGVGVGVIVFSIFATVVAQAVLSCLWAIVDNTTKLPEAAEAQIEAEVEA